MTTDPQVQLPEPIVEAPATPKQNVTPQEFLASIPGSPTPDMIANWKAQAPNNRIQVTSPDGKRAYILRGLTGLEVSKIQRGIASMATPTADPDLEMSIMSIVTACLWTNAGQNGKLTDTILRTGTAGLPATLFTVVTKLSDFMDPQAIEMMSADL